MTDTDTPITPKDILDAWPVKDSTHHFDCWQSHAACAVHLIHDIVTEEYATKLYLEKYENGEFSLKPPHWYVALMVDILGGILDAQDAPNYVEVTFKKSGDHRTWPVIVCRPGMRTPHELRAAAEGLLREVVDAYDSGAPLDDLLHRVSQHLDTVTKKETP